MGVVPTEQVAGERRHGHSRVDGWGRLRVGGRVYGLPDPRQVVPTRPWPGSPSYLGCALVGLVLCGLAAWRRPPRGTRAGCIHPGTGRAADGATAVRAPRRGLRCFPTIDKKGPSCSTWTGSTDASWHPLDAAHDPAARLIGVHVGHLWVTEAFDLVLEPLSAFSVQGIVYPAFGWGAASLLLYGLCGNLGVAVVLGMPFGMGLHVFRDLNWYTIEKAAVGWLALFGWTLARTRDGALAPDCSGGICPECMDEPVPGARLGSDWSPAVHVAGRGCAARDGKPSGFRQVAHACLACAAVGLPFALWQHHVSGGPAIRRPRPS